MNLNPLELKFAENWMRIAGAGSKIQLGEINFDSEENTLADRLSQEERSRLVAALVQVKAISHFQEMNALYGKLFVGLPEYARPARTTIETWNMDEDVRVLALIAPENSSVEYLDQNPEVLKHQAAGQLPKPIGPYSLGVAVENLAFTSAMISDDTTKDCETQVISVLQRIKHLLDIKSCKEAALNCTYAVSDAAQAKSLKRTLDVVAGEMFPDTNLNCYRVQDLPRGPFAVSAIGKFEQTL